MRLIDADALKQMAQEYGFTFVDLQALDNAPTIDAVPVVRCKDCVHWYDREEVCLKIYSDGAVHENAWQERKPDDFCSYGERKDGEEDG